MSCCTAQTHCGRNSTVRCQVPNNLGQLLFFFFQALQTSMESSTLFLQRYFEIVFFFNLEASWKNATLGERNQWDKIQTVENICRSLKRGGKKPENKSGLFRLKRFVAQFGWNRHKQIKVLSFWGDCIFQTSWFSVYFLTCHQADVYWFPLLTTKLITFLAPNLDSPLKRGGVLITKAARSACFLHLGQLKRAPVYSSC